MRLARAGVGSMPPQSNLLVFFEKKKLAVGLSPCNQSHYACSLAGLSLQPIRLILHPWPTVVWFVWCEPGSTGKETNHALMDPGDFSLVNCKILLLLI